MARPLVAVDELAQRTDPPGVGSVSKTPEGPPGRGTTFRFRQQTLGKIRETTTRYTAVDPNRRIDWDAED